MACLPLLTHPCQEYLERSLYPEHDDGEPHARALEARHRCRLLCWICLVVYLFDKEYQRGGGSAVPASWAALQG